MNWFYMARGEIGSRRILSSEQLSKMAQSGELEKNDLLCSEETKGQWVRAATISKLFPKPEPKTEKPKMAHAAQDTPVEKKTPLPPRESHAPKHHHRSALVAALLAVVAIAVFLLAGKFKKDPGPELPPPEQLPPETNIWETVEADVNALINQEELYEAQELIKSYETDIGGSDATSTKMRNALAEYLQKKKLTSLYAAFIHGKATAEQRKELVDLSRKTGELSNLHATLLKLLTAKDKPSQKLCRSILELAAMMKSRDLELVAVEALRSQLEVLSSEEQCMEIVKLYTEYEQREKAIALLEAFVNKNPDAANPWYELSAHLAMSGREEKAIEALKTAVKLGDKEVRIDARRDKRFDSIKDTWSFKWNTR